MKKQQIMIIAGVVIVLLIAGGIFMATRGSKQAAQQKTSVLDNSDAIPTVDPSVKVNLKGQNNNHDIVLGIQNVPNGTDSIDYELSYQTKEQGLQGIIGTVSPEGQKDVEKTATLGTCSSGVCVYHDVVGKIKVSLKFNGSYGERLYEKDHDLN